MSTIPVATKPLTRVTALALTDRIRKAGEHLWQLLLTAYEGKAHLALGYATWEGYIKAEFDMSRGQSYRLIDQARVTKALQEATGIVEEPAPASRARDTIQVSAREAAVLKPDLEEATTEIAEAVAAGATPVQAVREAVARRTEARKQQAPEPGPEPAMGRVIVAHSRPLSLERGDILTLVAHISETPPADAARLLKEHEVRAIGRWFDSVVAARQAAQPLATAVRERQEVEPRFKKAAQ